MTMNLKTIAFTAMAATTLSLGVLTATAAPASARVVCDWDGDDCWNTRHRYEDRNDWRRDWYERRRWEERRDRDAYRRWYWNSRPYYPAYRDYPRYRGYPGNSGGSVWFSF